MLDIPRWYYGIAVVIGIVVWRAWRWESGLLAGYVFFILAETVLIRKASGSSHLQLELFWSWKVWGRQRQQILTNVIMFIPVGALTGLMWQWRGLWFAAGLSIFIEVQQLISRRGLCEFDDVIHNILGALIGVRLVMLFRRIEECK